MFQLLEQRLLRIKASGRAEVLSGAKIGLEKESLRVAPDGGIAQTPHPKALGSALTNRFITTDFSEALAEMITPPCSSAKEALDYLHDLLTFVYHSLENRELLWGASMPCVLEGGDRIPVAQYGHSNAGMMKTVYRRGLGYRYGRTMQVIAGVHFNYSFPASFWELLHEVEEDTRPLKLYTSERYMALLRNMQRYGWLIPYFFGASPAVCKSFVQGKATIMSEFNKTTLYEPYATSLRLGDIGYTNNREHLAGMRANYNSLSQYIDSLRCAIETPYPGYEEIGIEVDGVYRQLNSNILQIENEYYSTVRPKQAPIDNEKPTKALEKRGIEYIEIRSLDVNVFDPLGITIEQVQFLEVLVLFCLLQASPGFTEADMDEIDENLVKVAHFGRDPNLELSRNGSGIGLKPYAREIIDAMRPVAELLDAANGTKSYSSSLAYVVPCIEDPSETPSARILEEMRELNTGFFDFAHRISVRHNEYFSLQTVPDDCLQLLLQESEASVARQKAIESADDLSFDEYLARYFAQ